MGSNKALKAERKASLGLSHKHEANHDDDDIKRIAAQIESEYLTHNIAWDDSQSLWLKENLMKLINEPEEVTFRIIGMK